MSLQESETQLISDVETNNYVEVPVKCETQLISNVETNNYVEVPVKCETQLISDVETNNYVEVPVKCETQLISHVEVPVKSETVNEVDKVLLLSQNRRYNLEIENMSLYTLDTTFNLEPYIHKNGNHDFSATFSRLQEELCQDESRQDESKVNDVSRLHYIFQKLKLFIHVKHNESHKQQICNRLLATLIKIKNNLSFTEEQCINILIAVTCKDIFKSDCHCVKECVSYVDIDPKYEEFICVTIYSGLIRYFINQATIPSNNYIYNYLIEMDDNSKLCDNFELTKVYRELINLRQNITSLTFHTQKANLFVTDINNEIEQIIIKLGELNANVKSGF
jgi:hypothetical protein